MFSTLMAKRDALMAQFSKVDVSEINDADLRAKAKQLKAKQRGFTLLELLVVVAILAAIAGTATISLSEAEKTTRSGLHASMMDGLTKALHTYPVLNSGEFPSHFDALVYSDGSKLEGKTPQTGAVPGTGLDATAVMQLSSTSFAPIKLGAEVVTSMANAGLGTLMALDGQAGSDCLTTAANDKLNKDLKDGVVKVNNLFRNSDGGGCGIEHTLVANDIVLSYAGKYQPLMGANGAALDAKNFTIKADFTVDDAAANTDAGVPVTVALGLGPSATLFDPNTLGGMTATPDYRDGTKTQYNRFIGLFQVGETIVDPADAAKRKVSATGVKFLGVVTPKGTFISEELDKYKG